MEEDLAKSLQNIGEIENLSLYKLEDIKLSALEIENFKKLHERKMQFIAEEAKKAFSRQVSDITTISQGEVVPIHDLCSM